MRLQLPQMRCRVEYGPRVAPEQNDSLRSWAENLIRAALWEVQMDKAFSAAYRSYIKSDAWRDKREWVFNRKGRKCKVCKSTENLHIHHCTYEMLGKERLRDLVPLCQSCHDLVHKMGGGYAGLRKLTNAKKKNTEYQAKIEKRCKRRLRKRRNKVIEDQKQKTTAFRPVTIIRRGTETIRREG